MNIKEVAFVSCCFDDVRYVEQQKILKESILKVYPDANLFFWTNELPKGAKKHVVSNYGFKVWAVLDAYLNGYKKIIWCDTALILQREVDELFELVKKYGVVAAQDDNLLYRYCGVNAFAYFDISVQESMEQKQHLVGGSMFVFDFNVELSRNIFLAWMGAEMAGAFTDASYPNHRFDEAIMSLCLYSLGSKPTPYDEALYNDVPNPIFKKVHFK